MRCQTEGDASNIPRENQNYSLIINLIIFEFEIKFIWLCKIKKIIMHATWAINSTIKPRNKIYLSTNLVHRYVCVCVCLYLQFVLLEIVLWGRSPKSLESFHVCTMQYAYPDAYYCPGAWGFFLKRTGDFQARFFLLSYFDNFTIPHTGAGGL